MLGVKYFTTVLIRVFFKYFNFRIFKFQVRTRCRICGKFFCVSHLLLFCENCSYKEHISENSQDVPVVKKDPDDPQWASADDDKLDNVFVMTGLVDGQPPKPRATRRCVICTRLSVSNRASKNLKKVGEVQILLF